MWIAWALSECVMYSMGNDPIDGSALKCQKATDGQEVFKRFWCLKSAMSHQSMEYHPNAKTSSDPVKDQANKEPLPTKNKKRRHRTHVEEAQEDRCVPIYLAI